MKKMNIFKRVISTLSAVIMTVSVNGFSGIATAANEKSDFTDKIDRIVYLVNDARAEAGLDPIYAVPYLNELATLRAEECVENFSHSRANGDSFITVIDYDTAPWITAGENIASGMATPEETFEQWKNSPSHWAAIMSPEFTHMGVGVAHDPDSSYGWYWQQLFIKLDTYEKPDGTMEGQYIPEDTSTHDDDIEVYQTGDLTGDGIVDSFDLVLLCRYLNGQVTLTPAQIKSAEILEDGTIDYTDVFYLKNYILGEITEMPVKL